MYDLSYPMVLETMEVDVDLEDFETHLRAHAIGNSGAYLTRVEVDKLQDGPVKAFLVGLFTEVGAIATAEMDNVREWNAKKV